MGALAWLFIVLAILVLVLLGGLAAAGAYFANQAGSSFMTGVKSIFMPNPLSVGAALSGVFRGTPNLAVGSTCPSGSKLQSTGGATGTGVCLTCPGVLNGVNACYTCATGTAYLNAGSVPSCCSGAVSGTSCSGTSTASPGGPPTGVIATIGAS